MALLKIHHYEKTHELLISKLLFQRIIHKMVQEQMGKGRNIRFQTNALMELQEVAEAYLVAFLKDVNFALFTINM